MRISSIVIGLTLLVCISLANAPNVATAQCCASLEDINVLMIVANGFGLNYWNTKEQFEVWGVNVTTIANSLDYEVDSCYNKDPRPAMADILISDFNYSDLIQYDAVFIPAGGHWSSLISSNRVLSLISTAHEMGLVIGTTCIGNRVLNRANNIVNHTKVASYSMTNTEMRQEGATIVYSALVVTDNRIVTGGAGGGPYAGGHEIAPTVEICAAMIKAIMGTSHVNTAEISPSVWNATATYDISVTTQDPADAITILNSTEILSVIAYVYEEGEYDTATKTITLTETDSSGVYRGSFSELDQCNYHIDIEVTINDETVEVVALGPSIIDETTEFVLPMFEMIVVIGIVGIMAALAIFLRRRS